MKKIEQSDYELASRILQNVWGNLDWESVEPRRRMTIHKEFEGQVQALSRCSGSFELFITRLCRRMKSYIDSNMIADLQKDKKDTIMYILREHIQVPMMLLRIAQNDKKERYEAKRLREKEL